MYFYQYSLRLSNFLSYPKKCAPGWFHTKNKYSIKKCSFSLTFSLIKLFNTGGPIYLHTIILQLELQKNLPVLKVLVHPYRKSIKVDLTPMF